MSADAGPGHPLDGHILVLQMQRLGDMILSFPLLVWLTKTYPKAPLWVVGEPGFYSELLPLSPKAYYIPWTDIEALPVDRYQLVVNLSHRDEAAALAGRLPSRNTVGQLVDADGARRIRGDFQLYRASIVHNNRHNRFHFAELWALDVIDRGLMRQTAWPAPRDPGQGDGAVGLFVGASQEEKRPSLAFYAELARELARRGLKPILFGGPGDAAFGAAITAAAGGRLANLCGATGLAQLAAAMGRLSLLITPDTGPMHLAAWTATPTLNLSMGPVNPYETGPYQSGHYVLTSGLSCRGCWHCRFSSPACKNAFTPKAVALLARELIHGGEKAASRLVMPGLSLMVSSRGPNGLYDLAALFPRPRASARDLLGVFWTAAFAHLLGAGGEEPARQAFTALSASLPRLRESFTRALPFLGARLKEGLSSGRASAREALWAKSPPLLRPLAGYAQMHLSNNDYTRQAYAHCLRLLETVARLTAA